MTLSDINIWGGFMSNCPDIALDTHIYQAWQEPSNAQDFYIRTSNQHSVS